MADLTINIGANIVPPTVDNNFITLNTQVYTFDVNSFIKNFVDPEGGTYDLVTIKSLIGINGLEYNGSPILINDSFPVSNSGLFEFTLEPRYSIHNGVLYEYDKDIAEIVTDYNAVGLELVANTNGLLTFIDPLNLADIQYLQGTALPDTTLSFNFTTSSTVSSLPSNEATFNIIPWENVNLKDNFYSLGGGGDGDSAYQVALTNGFVGTEAAWLTSLIGAPGNQGEPGAPGTDGADGTSVTILGSYATLGDLQAAQPTGATGDGYIVNGFLYVWNGSAWENVGLIQGPRGYDGRGLEYVWSGTLLGVRYEGQLNYSYVDLKGATGLKGDPGDKGDPGLQGLKGNTGLTGGTGKSAYQIWIDLGNAGTSQDFIDSLQGEQGIQGIQGLSAYQVWLGEGNTGTIAQYLLSLKGTKGDTGAAGQDASFKHVELNITWLTGQSQTFTVTDSSEVTDVYVDGKRAEKNNPDSTPDEWEVVSATQIRFLVPLNNNDRITIISSAKYTPIDLEYDWSGTQLGIRRSDEINYTYTQLKGEQGIQGIQGLTGISAYDQAVIEGFVGTEAQWLDSLTAEQFGESFVRWNTGDSTIFPVELSSKVTDVYQNGKRLSKFQEDGITVDEWRVVDSTNIEILVPLIDNDKIDIIIATAFTQTTNIGGVEQIVFTPVVKLDQNYATEKLITAPIAYTFDATNAALGCNRVDYVISDGINTPTYDPAVFVFRYNGWLNEQNRRHRVYFEYMGASKVIVDIVYL